MQGPSRGALSQSRKALATALASNDPAGIADELFAVGTLIDANPSLRRALGDSSADAGAKEALFGRIFGGKLSEAAAQLLNVVVSLRWTTDRDFTDAIDQLAVESLLTSADRNGRADEVEDELFRFERIVAGNPGLRDAMTDRQRSSADKAALVDRLLGGKVAPETARLAHQAAAVPRGRRYERALQAYIAQAAKLREQLTATVVAAVPLDENHRERLAQALAGIYHRPVQVNVIVDPQVVGGLRVLVGDEIIDGTVITRLDDARRHLAS